MYLLLAPLCILGVVVVRRAVLSDRACRAVFSPPEMVFVSVVLLFNIYCHCLLSRLWYLRWAVYNVRSAN